MKINIRIKLTTGETADFDVSLGLIDGQKLVEKYIIGSDLTFGYSGDAKVGRDIRDLTAELLSERFEKSEWRCAGEYPCDGKRHGDSEYCGKHFKEWQTALDKSKP